MIEITDRIALDEAEIVVTFIRASGPGGQNVNKVSSAAQLRFDVRHSPSLPDAVRLRLERIAGARMTKDGEIVITAGKLPRAGGQSQGRHRAACPNDQAGGRRASGPQADAANPWRKTAAAERQGEARRGEAPAAPAGSCRRLGLVRGLTLFVQRQQRPRMSLRKSNDCQRPKSRAWQAHLASWSKPERTAQ